MIRTPRRTGPCWCGTGPHEGCGIGSLAEYHACMGVNAERDDWTGEERLYLQSCVVESLAELGIIGYYIETMDERNAESMKDVVRAMRAARDEGRARRREGDL